MVFTNKLKWSGLLLSAMLVFASGCSSQPVATGEEEEKATPVKVMSVTKGKIEIKHEVVGKAQAVNEAEIAPKTAGNLVDVFVQKGAIVQAGDVLAKIDDTDLRIALDIEKTGLASAKAQYALAKVTLNKAEIGLQNAEKSLQQSKLTVSEVKGNQEFNSNDAINLENLRIQYENAKKNNDRMEALYNEGAVSKADYEQALTSYQQAELQLKQGELNSENSSINLEKTQMSVDLAVQDVSQAKASLTQASAGVRQAELRIKQANKRLEDTEVKSPISGEVVMVSAKVGELVSNQMATFKVVALDSIKINANVSADQLDLFEKDQTVTVKVPALHKTFDGKVNYVSAISNDAGLFTVEVKIENQEREIKPGMIASVIVGEDVVKEALLVPTGAVLEKNGKTYVYVITDGRAVQTEVYVLEAQTNETAISGDIHVNDEIVTKGLNTLIDGSKVKIIEEAQ